MALDLPVGWSTPPDSRTLAIISALDQLGDPPAGLLSMMLHGSLGSRASFVFRTATGGLAAGLEVRWIASDGRTLREVVDSTQTALEHGAIDVIRGRIDLPAGDAPFLEWEEPIRWGSIHTRAYFIQFTDGAARIDIGTIGVPDASLDRELRHILESIRLISS